MLLKRNSFAVIYVAINDLQQGLPVSGIWWFLIKDFTDLNVIIVKKTFRDNYSLVRHKKLRHNVADRYFKCVICPYRTPRAFNLKRHSENFHYGEFTFDGGSIVKCSICHKSFPSVFRLNEHMGMKETFLNFISISIKTFA